MGEHSVWSQQGSRCLAGAGTGRTRWWLQGGQPTLLAQQLKEGQGSSVPGNGAARP